ncbi:hypothetical protein BYT27DRAFT_7134699 [Phlegmacium glaucopus]|nr:hypothetical protein BYT27DRAFT_7134699 [Phlegmacium glaucopus]
MFTRTAFITLTLSLLSLLQRVDSSVVQIDARAPQATNPCVGVINCPLIPSTCPLGSHIGTAPGSCCPSCIKCSLVFCPDIACASDSKAALAPNACCPSCIPITA